MAPLSWLDLCSGSSRSGRHRHARSQSHELPEEIARFLPGMGSPCVRNCALPEVPAIVLIRRNNFGARRLHTLALLCPFTHGLLGPGSQAECRWFEPLRPLHGAWALGGGDNLGLGCLLRGTGSLRRGRAAFRASLAATHDLALNVAAILSVDGT